MTLRRPKPNPPIEPPGLLSRRFTRRHVGRSRREAGVCHTMQRWPLRQQKRRSTCEPSRPRRGNVARRAPGGFWQRLRRFVSCWWAVTGQGGCGCSGRSWRASPRLRAMSISPWRARELCLFQRPGRPHGAVPRPRRSGGARRRSGEPARAGFIGRAGALKASVQRQIIWSGRFAALSPIDEAD